MNKLLIIALVSLLGIGVFLVDSSSYARATNEVIAQTGGPGPNPTGGPGPNPNGGGQGSADVIQPPVKVDSIGGFISLAIRYLLMFVGALSVLFIIVGGFRMVVSGGNPIAIEKGKKTITWAIIGLIVSLMAFTIVTVLQSLLGRQ